MTYDHAPLRRQDDALQSAVVEGLSAARKSLPSRFLYDERGSKLFEQITRLDEYYPTRAESEILRDRAGDIAAFGGRGVLLIEYGAGAGVKTEILLAAFASPRLYIPIDIASDELARTATRIGNRFPGLETFPIVADFTRDFMLPRELPRGPRTAFFPGSTIGNLDRGETISFLRRVRRDVEGRGTAIIGVDLKKISTSCSRPMTIAAESQRPSTSIFSPGSIANLALIFRWTASRTRRDGMLSSARSRCISSAWRPAPSRSATGNSASARANPFIPKVRANMTSTRSRAWRRRRAGGSRTSGRIARVVSPCLVCTPRPRPELDEAQPERSHEIRVILKGDDQVGLPRQLLKSCTREGFRRAARMTRRTAKAWSEISRQGVGGKTDVHHFTDHIDPSDRGRSAQLAL